MTMWLYPRLPQAAGEALARERATMSIDDLVAVASCEHPDAIYGPTGGGRVPETRLQAIREAVTRLAQQCGFPGTGSEKLRRSFDAECAVVLRTMMGIVPAEASHVGVWTFVATVMFPHFVRWRFANESPSGTTIERFTGGVRGTRNTFGRLWWRAHLLRIERDEDPYTLLRALGEDELVQVTERPNLSGNARVNVAICSGFLDVLKKGGPPRSEILRDAMKRLRRLNSFVSFSAMDDGALEKMVDSAMRESVRALAPARAGARAPVP
jgi:hypothetical protein